MHCAADRDLPPRCLQRYHQAFLPKAFEHMEFDDSMIAQGMRTWNSEEGVSPEAWLLLSTAKTICVGCRNIFSIDGFLAHTAGGDRCSNSMYEHSVFDAQVPLHPAADSAKPPKALRQYHPSAYPTSREDYFCDSMIGRALIEWNSRVGIPLDAWVTVSSARVYCATCNRVRSFDGDSLHRDADGTPRCGGKRLGWDEGKEERPVWKGKGPAIV
ncbi:hypothetical protein FIBSPDRAFT_969220 [Athelia psychrophila]|uniref:Uncharacterized protein n=1 Tax=Athelia psychrophila TaxID=1759441 RepID=A0A167TR95_9AGAM|nr:hypothetical protein FIBSPDRAFT_969220 [Fibularhizoctonia sp. CBS 109695]